jgi:anaerobic magnesium-protoporphyrin IX monomethyl ester cyclase
VTKKILILDLNNFARYPSIAVGYLTAILRSGGFQVDLLAPLAVGLKGVPRESPPPWWGWLDLQFRYLTGVSRNRAVRMVRARYAAYRASQLARSKGSIVADFSRQLDKGYDAVLVSTYLMYYEHCVAVAEVCRERGVPLILGGPYFAPLEVAREWLGIPGVTVLVGGEIEPHLCELVRRVVAREPVDDLPGVWSQKAPTPSMHAPPLIALDNLPFPDYVDFPWSKYPNTIVPLITGRGCGWGVCTFCSDVTSTSGRTFRSRSPENVLSELEQQHRRHDARLFVFTDLKLNSNLAMWHRLGLEVQSRVPGARWIGAVHVGSHGDNGLSPDELRQARAGGMVRLTTGFESGSQRLLEKMVKGVDLAVTSRFLGAAHEAGISVRMTMFTGFPGEEAADIDETTAFLKKHERFIERLPIYRLQLMSGTRLAQLVDQDRRGKYAQLTDLVPNHRQALIEHSYALASDRTYRKAVLNLLNVVHQINRKPLRESARDFEGVM